MRPGGKPVEGITWDGIQQAYRMWYSVKRDNSETPSGFVPSAVKHKITQQTILPANDAEGEMV